jgi:glucose uptake protein
MYLPGTYSTALLMMIITTICWGSWANTYKFTKDYRFELFYWDYIFGMVLFSIVLAFTMGSMGSSGQAFLPNLSSADGAHFAYALIAGFIFNIANLLLVAGIDITGLSVAFPIAIGIAIVEGVVLSYIIQPKGNAVLLALGVTLALAAIIFDALAYKNLGSGGEKRVSSKGIVINIVSGLLMGGFAPFVTKALTGENALTPYSIIVLFALGSLLCCFVVNVYFMRRPLVGESVNFSGYFAADGRDHALGLVGGVIWGIGGAFNFIAAGVVGVAISYAIGQAAPMIAALWGVAVWKEFRGANTAARAYLFLMFVFYLLAVACNAMAHTRGE